MLPVHVISLKRAAERRQNIDRQFELLGVRFDYFDAFDCKTISSMPAVDVDLTQFLLNTGRAPADGEIACFLSHRELWKLCAEQGKALMILEDDCTLCETFLAAVSTPDCCVEDLGIIRLQGGKKNVSKYPLFAMEGITYWRYTKVPFGACGYLLSPAAAQKLLDASGTITAPVDSFLKMPWVFDQSIHAMSPYPIELSPLSHDSQIASRRRENFNWRVVLWRPVYKGINWLKRLSFNRRQLKQADRKAHYSEESAEQVVS